MEVLLCILFIASLGFSTSTSVSYTDTSARIVNGFKVDIKLVAYQASLRKRTLTGWTHSCGAVLLKSRALLTAAHCVDELSPSVLRVVVGTESRTTGGQSYDVSNIYMHESYSSTTLVNDIAMLRTVKEIAFSENVHPIVHAPAGFILRDGSDALVSGFGTTSFEGSSSSVLMAARVQIVNQEQCFRSYLSMATVTPEMICAGASNPPRDACQGDSGGPLVAYDILIGIVSWGEGCASTDYPGVYTRVSEYNEWINNKISIIYS